MDQDENCHYNYELDFSVPSHVNIFTRIFNENKDEPFKVGSDELEKDDGLNDEDLDPLLDKSFFLTDSHKSNPESTKYFVTNYGKCTVCFPAQSRKQTRPRRAPYNLPQIEPFSHFIYYATLHANHSLINILVSDYEDGQKHDSNPAEDQKLTFIDLDLKRLSIEDVDEIHRDALKDVHNFLSLSLFNIGDLKEGQCLICDKRRMANSRLCCNTLICNECMSNYISVKVEQNCLSQSTKIECPSCSVALNIREIVLRLKHSLFKNAFTIYSRRLVELSCNENEFICPASTCGNVIKINEPYRTNTQLFGWVFRSNFFAMNHKVKCNMCGTEACSNCKSVSHDGITCKKFRNGDHSFHQWAQTQHQGCHRNATKCPGCKRWYHKTEGCDHMTCSQCGTEFCYLCGGSFKRNLFGHHSSKYRINGCTKNLLYNRPILRKAVRGSILTGTIILAPILLLLYILRMILFTSGSFIRKVWKKTIKKT